MMNMAKKIIVYFMDFIFAKYCGISKDISMMYLYIIKKKYYPIYANRYHQMLLKAERLFKKIDPTRTYPRLHTALRRSTIFLHFNQAVFDPSKDIDEYLRLLDQFPNSIEACMAAYGLAIRYLKYSPEDSIKGFNYCYLAARNYLQAHPDQRAPTTLWWHLFARFDLPISATTAGICIKILQWYLKQPQKDLSLLTNKRAAQEIAEALGMEQSVYWQIYREVSAEVRSWTYKGTHPKMKLRRKGNSSRDDSV